MCTVPPSDQHRSADQQVHPRAGLGGPREPRLVCICPGSMATMVQGSVCTGYPSPLYGPMEAACATFPLLTVPGRLYAPHSLLPTVPGRLYAPHSLLLTHGPREAVCATFSPFTQGEREAVCATFSPFLIPERHTRVVNLTVTHPRGIPGGKPSMLHTREAYPGLYSLYPPGRHTRVVYSLVHTWEAYPGIYSFVHTWEAYPGINLRIYTLRYSTPRLYTT